MSGLRKAKKYDWQDSNMALFGSDTEKQVKKESAESERAWHGCGQKPGLRIWRVNKFKIEPWAEGDYGKFYEGDSYIILNTYKEKDNPELLYDVHFWIGKYSTQDEYGTAAYKTVELDTFLDDKPVQHREVQGHETSLFKGYFSAITTMKGGADSGFRKVPVESYTPRLLKFQKTGRSVKMTEVPKKRATLDEGDVFILDNGLEIMQWNGAKCNQMEKYAAAQELNKIKTARVSKGTVNCRVYEQEDLADEHRFYSLLGDDEDDDDDDDDDQQQLEFEGGYDMARVTDDDGSIGMEEVPLDQRKLSDDDVLLFLCKSQLYVYVGKNASIDERRNGLSYGHQFLQSKNCPLHSITVVPHDKQPSYFKKDIPIAA